MFCPNCGAQLKDGAKFCSKCGKSMNNAPVSEQKVPVNQPEGSVRQSVKRPVASVKRQEAAAKMPPPPTPDKKKNKGLIITLLVILLALVVGVGAGAVYFINARKDEALLESVKSQFSSEDDEEDELEAEEEEMETETETEEGAEPTAPTLATQAPTSAAGAAETTAMPGAEPITAFVQYADQTSLSGMMRAGVLQGTAVQSSHVVQAGTTIDNSGWSAFDGQSTTSWQEGVDGDGIGEYVGISFDREYQVQVITLLLGNHRSDSWYVKNNTPQTLSINLSGQVFQVTFPKEKREFAVVLSRPAAASDIRITIDAVYPGTEYTDTIISEVGVYGN